MKLLSVSDLARVSFPDRERPGLMAMLECYFDDSGTHDASPVVTWGGLVGTKDQWEFLDRRWRALLVEPLQGEASPPKPSLRQFHLSHCAALDGEFESYSRAESDRLRYLFRQIIADSGVESYAYSVSTRDYDGLVKGKLRKQWGSANRMAAVGCITRALVRANERREQFVSVMMDRGAITDEIGELMRQAERRSEGETTLVCLGSMPVVNLTPLQAADTIATESFWSAKKIICNDDREHSAHLKSMLGKVELIRGFIMERKHVKGAIRA